jgi:hypothetical protein
MEESLIISFASTNYAMQTEAYLKAQGIAIQIMPTPREITLSCGLSIKTAVDNLDKIKNLVDNKRITIKALYLLKIMDRQRVLEKIDF